MMVLAQAESPVEAAWVYAAFGGVLVSAVVAGLTVHMGVRRTGQGDHESASHALALALALLTPSVLLFTALHGRVRWSGSAVAFLLPLVLLAAGGVLMFSGLYWLSATTGGGDEELKNWRVLSRAAAVVAIAMIWQSFGRMRRVVYDDPEWKTSRHSVLWVIFLVLPLLLTHVPRIRRVLGSHASQQRSARILRWAVMLFITLVCGLWVAVTDEQVALLRRDWFVEAFTLALAAGLGTLLAVFEMTLPAPRFTGSIRVDNDVGLVPSQRDQMQRFPK